MVLPFVFRRYLDYSVFDALRVLHRQIRDHAARRSAGHPERANDVKLSRGGIREIEFTVQLLQVVRGGQFPELRTRPTLDALQRLANAGLMPQETADALAQAYPFCAASSTASSTWTTSKPTSCPRAMTTWPGSPRPWATPTACAFLCQLDAHRELVAQEFDTLLGGGAKKRCNGELQRQKRHGAARPTWTPCWRQLPEALRERVAQWRDHPRVLALRDEARVRLVRLVQRTAQWLTEGRVTEDSRGAPGRLDRAAAAPRKLPGAAAGAPHGARAPAAPAGRGALASALPAASTPA